MAKKKKAVVKVPGPYRAPELFDRGPGAPSKLTPQNINIILTHVKAGSSNKDACGYVGISEDTLMRWIRCGRAEQKAGQKDGEYYKFCRRLEDARRERRSVFRMEAMALSRKKEDWRGVLAVAALVEPDEFAQKVHVVVVKQFDRALKKLEEEFADEPDILERALAAIAEESGANKTLEAEEGESAEFDDAGGEIHAASAVTTAIGISRPDM